MSGIIDEVLAVVRAGGDGKVTLAALREIGGRHMPQRNWRAIRLPQVFETDILEMTRWINSTVEPYSATNVYWALHTPSERADLRENISTGMTNRVPSDADFDGWSIQCEGPRESHVIWGLTEIHTIYEKWNADFQVNRQVDYILFLGYSGLVIASAVERCSVRRDCRFLWGFGEECPRALIRTSSTGAVRL